MRLWLILLALPMLAAERPKELVAFADLARSLPPEFAADLLLRLAEHRADPAWRSELVEEAFSLAARAPEAYPTVGGSHTDCRAYVTSSQHGLDAMSLRMRAVRITLPANPERAAAMFIESPLPPLPPSTCDAIHVPQLFEYYRTLALVYDKGFSIRQRERGEPRHLLERAIRTMVSPSQVLLLGELILRLTGERQVLLDAYAGALARVTPDDRAFAPDASRVLALVRGARLQRLSVTALLPAIRAYYVAHFTGARCAPDRRRTAELATRFNQLASEVSAEGTEVPSLAEEQLRPERDAGKWDDGDFWRSPRSKAVMEDLRWLNHGNRNLPGDKRFWTEEERKSQEWTGRYQELQKRIEGWRESEEQSPVDFRWMQSFTLSAAAKLVPPGPARDLAFRRWLTNFEQWYEPGTPQNAWFGMLKRMLEEKEFATGDLRRSRIPVIAAYAEWMSMSAAPVHPPTQPAKGQSGPPSGNPKP